MWWSSTGAKLKVSSPWIQCVCSMVLVTTSKKKITANLLHIQLTITHMHQSGNNSLMQHWTGSKNFPESWGFLLWLLFILMEAWLKWLSWTLWSLGHSLMPSAANSLPSMGPLGDYFPSRRPPGTSGPERKTSCNYSDSSQPSLQFPSETCKETFPPSD